MAEVIEVLTAGGRRSLGSFLDATAGTGGHLLAVARHLRPGGVVVAVDRDASALVVVRRRVGEVLGSNAVVREAGAGERPASVEGSAQRAIEVITTCGDFKDLPALVGASGCATFDGVLFDLGVSSWQLDDPERGFSFQRDGPLRMTMNSESRLTAEHIVNRYSEVELERIFREEGEERWARRIAAAIGRRRRRQPIRTSGDLARLIAGAVPPSRRRPRIHPATRAFMALRMAVNREVESLEAALVALPGLLNPGGRAVFLAYHSIEDRLVKRAFRQAARAGLVAVLTPKPVRPSPAEVAANRRARSARLRAVERLGGEPPGPSGGED